MLALPEVLFLPLGRRAETGIGVFVVVEGAFVGDEKGVGEEGRVLGFFLVLALGFLLTLPEVEQGVVWQEVGYE